jgi:hypothetical protein
MDSRLMNSINISLKREKSRVHALFVLTIENPRIKKQNVLLTIGNVVSVLVIIVILVFNYILINAKVIAKKYM